MNPKVLPPQNFDPRQRDESYWSSLFEQESVTEPASAPVVDVEWEVGHENGRFRPTPPSSNQTDPWQTAKIHFESDESLSLTVVGYNKGGLLVQWGELQGFVPASQLINFPQFHFETERLRALKEWMDKTLNLKIIELNPQLNRLILSERAAQVKATDRTNLLHKMRPGEVVHGQITNLTEFGAFVDLGGVEGLIHISELSWSRVSHPSDVVKPNQSVSVRVLHIDNENQRVALSLKQLKADPWQTANSRYQVGQIVEGVVTNVVNFGAFVLLEEELEGLIHISELAEGSFLHPRNVVNKGDTVTARVILVDTPAKRLALSLRGIANPINGR